MRSKAAHPSKPSLAIRVGVAGTRDSVAEVPGLADEVRSFLRMVKEQAHTILRDPDSGYDPGKSPKLILICALAAGADQFVADIAIEEGYYLHVPLAFPRDKYAEMNFESTHLPRELKHFNRLYAAAESRLELDGTEQDGYDVAGSVLVAHSDVLLAIWDGGPGKGPGGTADSVSKAVQAGIPVVKFDSRIPADAQLQYGSAGSMRIEELPAILRDLLLAGLHPPHHFSAEELEQSQSSFARERKHLRQFTEETEKRVDWSAPYRIITGLLALQVPRFQFTLQAYRRGSEKAWPPIEDAQPDCARSFFQPLDMWPDFLAIYYANWMRGLVALTIILGAIIVDYVLAVRFWPALPDRLEDAGGGLALLFVFLVSYARRRSVQRRWLQYRMLSQLLRNSALALALGCVPRRRTGFRSADGFQPNWVQFYRNACVRAFGVGCATLNGAYLRGYRDLLLDRIRGQYRYHRGRSRLCTILNRNIRKVALFVFLVTVAGTILHIVQAIFHIVPKAYESRIDTVVDLSLLFSVLSGAIAAFAAQESFAKLAQASANIAIHLNQLSVDVEHTPLAGAALREQALRVTDELEREHEDWYLLYSLREIEYS
jgi:hypothetical protein